MRKTSKCDFPNTFHLGQMINTCPLKSGGLFLSNLLRCSAINVAAPTPNEFRYAIASGNIRRYVVNSANILPKIIHKIPILRKGIPSAARIATLLSSNMLREGFGGRNLHGSRYPL